MWGKIISRILVVYGSRLHMKWERKRLMQLQFTPYVFPVVATAVLLALLALATWRHRTAQGAPYFCLLMLAMAEWSLGYALELTGRSLSSALFWDNIAWIGAIAAPTLWLIFV